MIIKIKKHGHQHYSETIGKVLSWTQTVEIFHERKTVRFFQVPAVMVIVDDKDTKTETVQLIPLKTQGYWTEIEVLGGDK